MSYKIINNIKFSNILDFSFLLMYSSQNLNNCWKTGERLIYSGFSVQSISSSNLYDGAYNKIVGFRNSKVLSSHKIVENKTRNHLI